jgi:hypothetical protein
VADYASLAAVADRLIRENGRDVVLTRNDRAPADASKPWRGPASPGAPTNLTVKAVFVDPMGSGWGREDEDEPFGVLKRGAQLFMVSATAVSSNLVETFDALTDGADLWKIDKVHKLKPGTVNLLYGLEVSR